MARAIRASASSAVIVHSEKGFDSRKLDAGRMAHPPFGCPSPIMVASKLFPPKLGDTVWLNPLPNYRDASAAARVFACSACTKEAWGLAYDQSLSPETLPSSDQSHCRGGIERAQVSSLLSHLSRSLSGGAVTLMLPHPGLAR